MATQVARRRTMALGGTSVALVAASVLIVALIGGAHWWRHDRQRGHVAIPPAGSTPVEVVTAYVEAANANDRSTERTLGDGALGGLTAVRLREPAQEVPAGPDGDRRVGTNLEVRGGGASMPNGPWGWDFYLRRGGPAGWTIDYAGQG